MDDESRYEMNREGSFFFVEGEFLDVVVGMDGLTDTLFEREQDRSGSKSMLW